MPRGGNAQAPGVQVRAFVAWDFHRWFDIDHPGPFSERQLAKPPNSRRLLITIKSVKSERSYLVPI